MRVTLRFVVAIAAVILLVLGVKAAYELHRDIGNVDEDVRNDTRLIGTVVAHSARRLWNTQGERDAVEFVDQLLASGKKLRIRWVWLDAAADDARAPSRRVPGLEHAAPHEAVAVMDEGAGGSQSIYTYVPLGMLGGRPAAIEVTKSLTDEHALIRSSMIGAIASTLILFVLAGGLVTLLGRRFIAAPIAQLVDKARRIGAGDLETPLRLRQRDELGDLADEMTRMGQRLAREIRAREAATEQLRLADRLTTVGRLASGLAHELGTPLSVVSGRALLIVDGEVEGADVIENARTIHEQSQRMTRLIRELLDFARPRPLEHDSVELRALAERTVALLAPLARKAEVSLELAAGAKLSIAADPGQLQQVLTNLVVNAIHACLRGGKVTIGAEALLRGDPAAPATRQRPYARLWVRDDGSGMDEATKARIFEPFFTTKDVGEGTGLGLPVSYGIAREHGGWIDVETAPGQGSTFSVFLPTDAATAS